MVGGCVRDLLLGLRPKDYDIATAARPQQVKRTFPRNCRIIGRRFKLAHLHFHGNTKILEVSTFRQMPLVDSSDNLQPDLLIKHDNEFGTAEEDALRRDFTVNALFLDVGQNCILDYANGLEDLYNRTIRTIGDPRVRFREDPVRILRAVKFAGRLGFRVEAETLAAMAETAPDLVRSAPPRLLEEILRLLRGGHALDSFQLLRDVGALKSLIPVLADFLATATQPQRVQFWRILEALDQRVHEGHVPPNPVLLGALLLCPVLARCAQNPNRSPSTVAEELLGPLSITLRLPRRDSGCLKRICGVAHRFLQLDDPRRFKVAGFSTGPYFEEALELFQLRAAATGIDPKLVAEWQTIAAESRLQRRHYGDEPFDADDGELDEVPPQHGRPRHGTSGETAAAETEESSPEAVVDHAAIEGSEPDRGESDGAGRRRRRRRRRGGRNDLGGNDLGGNEPVAGVPVSGERHHAEDGLAASTHASSEHLAGDFSPEDHRTDGEDAEVRSELEGPPSEVGGSLPNQEAGEDCGSRRRRRRRRRRGGAGGSHDDGPEVVVDGTEPQHAPRALADVRAEGPPRTPRPQQQQQRNRPQPDRSQRDRPQQDRPPQDRGPRTPRPSDRPDGGGRPDGGSRPDGGGRPDGGRRRDRDRNRQGRGAGGGGGGRGRRDGAPRDVDVVPRGADRRGRVDVIEPPPLDLTAFDIELDPKRVPTFGSIVEGKGRPKRRPPRMPDEGRDDYKPPPPPGQGDDPSNAPPPPVDDTFGDW